MLLDLAAAADVVDDVEWSICVRDLTTGREASHDPDRQLRTASVGKIILLVEVARRIGADPAYGKRLVARTDTDAITDSGVLQHLSVDRLSVADLAALVGYASDNLATNLLLDDVGLAAVGAAGRQLGLHRTELLDRVRRPRTTADPPALSVGTAAELCDLMARLRTGELLAPGLAAQVNGWLGSGVDLSMVGAAFGFDPLSHPEDDRGLRLVNKTGTDTGIRADVGHVTGPAGRAAYAVLANWPGEGPDRRDIVLDQMRRIGSAIRAIVS